MNNIAYYHLYLTDDPIIWTSIFMEQMRSIQYSGLMDNLECIRLRCITKEDSRVRMLADLSKMYSVPIDLDYLFNQYRNDYHMHFHHNEDEAYEIGQSESITLKKIYDDAQHEDKRIVYFHSKGVTSYFDRVAPIAIKEHKLNCDTRHYLNWGVLERWRECVAALETHDTAGISLIKEPLQYYAGNFWWTKSSHIRNLLDPISFEWKQKWQQLNHSVGNKFYKRCGDEMWLCSNNPTSYDIQGNSNA